MKYFLYLLIGILCIGSVFATPVIYWIAPSQDYDTIDTYPEEFRIFVKDTNTINNCTIWIDKMFYVADINANQGEINIKEKIPQGVYYMNVTCTGVLGDTTESKVFKINDMITFQKKNDRDFLFWLWIAVNIILILMYMGIKNNLYKLLISIMLILASVAMLQETNNIIMWIPIGIGAIMGIYHIIRSIK